MKNSNSDEEVSSSDSDGECDEIDESQTTTNRHKRAASSKNNWCDVVESSAPTNKRVQITWPPSSTSTFSSNWRNLRPTRPGNPYLGNRMQLFSKTQHFLGVYADGTVKGTKDPNDIHTHLEIISANYPGHVKIRGMLTKLYVAMDRKGRLYAEADSTDEATVFIESFQGSYNTYLSRNYAHFGWYLGIKKSGKFKRGPKTAYGQKAIQFLPRRTKFE